MRVSAPDAPALHAALPVRPATILGAALFLSLLANLGRIPAFHTGEREAVFLFNDVFIGVALLTGLLAMAQARLFRLDRTAFLALTFAGLGALSAVASVPRFGISAYGLALSLSYLVRWLFYFGVYVVAINTIRAADVSRLWRTLEAAIIAFSIFGMFQSAFLPDFALMVYPEGRRYLDWDPQGHRLVSTILDPNFAGMFILMGLLIQVAGIAVGHRVAAWKPLLLLVALVLTASRSSILAFFVGGALILLVRGITRRMAYAIGVLIVLFLAALPQLLAFGRSLGKLTLSDPSAMSRVTVWLRGLRVFSDHWLIGVGFNTWGFVGEWYGWERGPTASYAIDGGLLFIAVMTGVVGLALYLGMMLSMSLRARAVWRNGAQPAEHRAIALGTVAASVAMVVHSLFTNSILLPFLMAPMWTLWGLVAVSYRAGPELHRS